MPHLRSACLRCLALAWLVLAGGCWTSSAAAPDRGRRPADLAAADEALHRVRWPERTVVPLQAIRAATPPVVMTLTRDPVASASASAPPSAEDRELVERLSPLDRVTVQHLTDRGLLRIYDESDGHEDGFLEDVIVGFDTDADFLSSWWLDSAPGRSAFAFKQGLDAEVARAAGSAGLTPTTRHADVRLREGVRLGLPAITDSPPRGLLVRLPALTGTSFEAAVVDRLERDGWAVLNIRPYRFVLPRGASFPVPDGEDGPERAGRAAAVHLDEMFADAAYAAEAALAHLDRTRPELAALPRALIGFSSGSFSAPAVAAAMGEDLDAVILVGSGAGLPDLARRSHLTDSGLRFRMADGSGVPPSLQARVDAAFAGATTLAPESLAPVLRRVPVLQVHAVLDVIVPASAGDRLYRLLGEPERLRFLGGHRGLFYFLPRQANRIAAWLDRAVPPVRTPDASATSHRRESNP